MIRANPYSNEGPDTKRQHLEENNELSVYNQICDDILSVIFSTPGWKSKDLITCNYVCKQWNRVVTQGSATIAKELAEMVKNNQAFVFGKKEWETYLGNVEAEPPLPRDICQILNSKCPIKLEHLEGSIGKTHMLIWIPKKVNGSPLTYRSLQLLIYNPSHSISMGLVGLLRSGSDDNFREDNIFKEKPAESNWILLTADLLDGSRNHIYPTQEKLVTNCSDYEVPRALNIMIAMAAKLVSTGKSLFKLVNTGDLFYSQKSCWMRCCDHVLVNNGFDKMKVSSYFGPSLGARFAIKSESPYDFDSETGVAASRLL